VSRCKIAFVRQGQIAGFQQYEVASLPETLNADLQRFFFAPAEKGNPDAVYDEFCLVSNFIVDPLQSVDLIRVENLDTIPEEVLKRLQQRKRRRTSTKELATEGT